MNVKKIRAYVLNVCLLWAIGLGMLYGAANGLHYVKEQADVIDCGMTAESNILCLVLFLTCLTIAVVGRAVCFPTWQGIVSGLCLWGYAVFHGVRHGLMSSSWQVFPLSLIQVLGTTYNWPVLLTLAASISGVLLGTFPASGVQTSWRKRSAVAVGMGLVGSSSIVLVLLLLYGQMLSEVKTSHDWGARLYAATYKQRGRNQGLPSHTGSKSEANKSAGESDGREKPPEPTPKSDP